MGKRLPPKKRAVKRAAVPKVAKSATKRKAASSRSKSAQKGWETRRKRAVQAEATRRTRSEAAKRGWQKRYTTALEKEGLSARSAEQLGELSADQQQLLHNMRLAVMGPMGFSEDLTGRNPSGLEVLRNMVQYRDKRWETFTQYAQAAGFSSQQARTAFFSPSVKRMMRARAPGLRP
jgi:hypothetical protein